MVSVLLAACNGERWLPAQLDSLGAQTLPDLRILWRDDGSSDGTAALLHARERADGRLQHIPEDAQHLGAAGSFLALMAADDAPYSALCDQDDDWPADKLARCLAALREAEAR